jgi:predicted transcriptional regulator
MDRDFAIRKAGTQAKLAKLLGVSRQAVNQWGDKLPPLQVYRLREIRPRWYSEWKKLEASAQADVATDAELG